MIKINCRYFCHLCGSACIVLLMVLILQGCQKNLATGSPPASDAGKTLSGQMEYGDRSREYVIHFPKRYQADDAYPLVLALHGGFGKAENMEKYTGLSEKADKELFIVAYPQGVRRSWNAGRCCGPAHKRKIDDVGFLSALIDSLTKNYAVNTDRIFVTGLSNGGFMAYQMLCKQPEKIKAIAPVAASMVNSSCKPGMARPIVQFHSYEDDHVPYWGGSGKGPSDVYKPPLDSVFKTWSNINDCSVQQDTVQSTTELDLMEWRHCNQQAILKLYLTKDGGHSWPGGSLNFPDPASDAVNATDKMWDFFEAQ